MPDEILRYAELTEEPSFAPTGDIVAASDKSIWIDTRSIAVDAPNEADAPIESSFGRAASKKYAGFYNPAGDFAFATNVRNMPYAFKWALGGYAFTAGLTGPPVEPNIHESWGSDLRSLPSFQGRFGKDQMEHMFKGLITESLEIEAEDELAVCTIEVSGAVDKKQSIQNAVAVLGLLPTEIEMPFHAITVSIAGVVQARKIKNVTFSVANNTDAEAGRYLGSRYPGRIPANERETTTAMEMDFSNTAEIERLWGGATGPTNLGASTFPVEMTFYGGKNAGNIDQNMIIGLPKMFYTAVETQPEGREEIVQSVEGRALLTSQELDDGTTTVTTDVYTKVLSMAAAVMPGTVV